MLVSWYTFSFCICMAITRSYQQENACGSCVILTPFIRNGSTSEARRLASVDSENFLSIESYSGFITVKEEFNSNLFFWYFPFENRSYTTPWIIWLQGGPGFSSMVGLFDFIGPLKVENDEVTLRNVTWANDYSLLFVDNPVGAGFSFTTDERGYLDNEDDVGEQLFELLQQFLQMFPELRQAPLFIAGESYAGKYVPALGIQIHKYANSSINLRGLLLGNSLIDPRSVVHYSELCKAMGILSDPEIEQLRILEQNVIQLLDDVKMVDAANMFNDTIEYMKSKSGVNIYNLNTKSDLSLAGFEDFINSTEARNWIHVGNASFDLNNQLVYKRMLPDIMNSTKMLIEELLEHYGVMCYSGQLDLILPYSQTHGTYLQMMWSARQEYLDAPRRRLRRSDDGSVIAYKQSGGNFVEVLIRHCGHFVALEEPEVLKFVLDSFIHEFK